MSNEEEQIRKGVESKFERILDGLILDPNFEYELRDVEVIDRTSMNGSDTEKVFVINVRTNNRSQLLGQVYPFTPGDYRGYLNNFYSGRIIEKIENEFEPSFRFFVEVNVLPLEEEQQLNYVDRHIELEKAIDNEIIEEDCKLAKKMREYSLTHLILAGGNLITGPLASSMGTMETVYEKHQFNSVLDMFSGSGALSRVAIDNGAEEVECLDLDITSCRNNLEDYQELITFHEMDAFDFKPNKEYDLIIADPYYSVAPDFIDRRLSYFSGRCDYFFMTIASVGSKSWEEKILDKLKKHFDSIERFDTGRIVQVLCK